MGNTTRTRRMFAVCAAVLVAALALLPNSSLAQQSAAERMSAVTEDYTFQMLLPAMSPEGLSSTRNIASWYLNAAKTYETRAAEMRKQINLQREAKKAEIKTLEARAQAAGSAKDDILKKQLEAAVKEQKLELNILDSVKKLSENEASIAGQYESTGKALESLAVVYESLTKTRESVLKDHEKTVEAATQAGLPAPMPPINYEMNNKALKSLGEAGKNMKGLGERLGKIAKCRQELPKNWGKRFEANAKR